MPLSIQAASILVGFTTAYADALYNRMNQQYRSALRVACVDRLVVLGLTREAAMAECDRATHAVTHSPDLYTA